MKERKEHESSQCIEKLKDFVQGFFVGYQKVPGFAHIFKLREIVSHMSNCWESGNIRIVFSLI